MKGGKVHPSQESEAQRGAKQARVGQMGANKRSDSQVEPPSQTPTPMLDGALLLTNASIRDFHQGKDGYVADAMEQALQLSKDMANLRSLRGHEVFLSLKRDLAMVSLSINPSLPFFFFFWQVSSPFFPLLFPSFHLYRVSFLGRLFKPRFGQRR